MYIYIYMIFYICVYIYIDVARWKCITMWGTPFVTLGRGVLMVDDKGLYTSVVYNIYIHII